MCLFYTTHRYTVLTILKFISTTCPVTVTRPADEYRDFFSPGGPRLIVGRYLLFLFSFILQKDNVRH